jgi:hypothetical protein
MMLTTKLAMRTDAQRRSVLFAALGFFAAAPPSVPAMRALHAWLDTWNGIGQITGGMARQGYDLQLTRYDERGWRATFYASGMEHSATGATGSAWEPTPWRAVQRAALSALLTERQV